MRRVRRDEMQGAGHDVTCALSPAGHDREEVRMMSRFVAPLSFTVAAVWVVILFFLVHSTP